MESRRRFISIQQAAETTADTARRAVPTHGVDGMHEAAGSLWGPKPSTEHGQCLRYVRRRGVNTQGKFEFTDAKVPLTLAPRPLSTRIATTAMSARINAYSTRLCALRELNLRRIFSKVCFIITPPSTLANN